jgi:hypothetical protein
MLPAVSVDPLTMMEHDYYIYIREKQTFLKRFSEHGHGWGNDCGGEKVLHFDFSFGGG